MVEAIALAAVPVQHHEGSIRQFLRAAVESSTGLVTDPEQWTVQERTLVVCHYLAATLDDGPDFALDAEGGVRYGHYLSGTCDYSAASVDVGEIGGDRWAVHHLTGALAGAIERTQGEVPGLDGSSHWLFGRMAAQLVPNGQALPATGDVDAALVQRMRVISQYPESVFVQLLAAFERAQAELAHLFAIDNDDEGLIVLPRAEVPGTPPARFPVGAGLTPVARRMGRRPAAPGA